METTDQSRPSAWILIVNENLIILAVACFDTVSMGVACDIKGSDRVRRYGFLESELLVFAPTS
jgi:hypothetical protein